MEATLSWSEELVRISDLKGWEQNPRSISKSDFKRLVNDIKQDGYHRRIMVDDTNVIIGGHSRRKALLSAGYRLTDYIKVLKPSRPLTEEELKRINIRDNLDFGDWDLDKLANSFEIEDLKSWGMPDSMFGMSLDLEGATEMSIDAQTPKTPKTLICPECGCVYDSKNTQKH